MQKPVRICSFHAPPSWRRLSFAGAMFFLACGSPPSNSDPLKVQGSRLTWDANTEADLAGYKVYAGLASGVYGQNFDVGFDTAYALYYSDGLTRYFAVTAYDTSANESGYSNEVVWTAPAPEPTPVDTMAVNWPDDRTLRMRVVYQKKDAAGNPLLPAVRLQMEKFDATTNYGWLDKFPGADYIIEETDDSTSVIDMGMSVLRAGIPQADGKYIWAIRFRVRLENPDDASKATAWVNGSKSVQLVMAVDPREGVPLLPTFRILFE